MRELLPLAEKVAAALKARKETLAVAEAAAGGLICAALLAVPGASAYFIGGGVLYTRRSLCSLLNVEKEAFAGLTPATERWALRMARLMKERCGADWAVAETGAAGPTGNRYGNPPGHACIAVVGPAAGPAERAITLETGNGERTANMHAFAAAALDLLSKAVDDS